MLEKKRAKGADIKYKLRARNHKNRLDKGYWFLGNEKKIILSFWEGIDQKNHTPNIYLELSEFGQISLVFTSKDSIIKGQFFKELTSVLGGFKQSNLKGKTINFWRKIYTPFNRLVT